MSKKNGSPRAWNVDAVVQEVFEVIIGFGMDWLAYIPSYHRLLYEISVYSFPNGEILKVPRRMRPKGSWIHLQCIRLMRKKLDDIRVVRDFPVFPDDLLGLPHVREKAKVKLMRQGTVEDT
ncbi:hypothetical protein Tco_0351586 [Tanacetum coccineum]